MPIFEYQCLSCNGQFELIIKTKETIPKCPNCESTELKKLFSTPAVMVKEHGLPSACPGNASTCGNMGSCNAPCCRD